MDMLKLDWSSSSGDTGSCGIGSSRKRKSSNSGEGNGDGSSGKKLISYTMRWQ